MFVGTPVFPISFPLEKVAELIEETILKKNWKRFEKGEVKLVLTPFYLFYYDVAFEKKGKPTGKTKHGRLAINGETAELSKELAESIPNETELVQELSDEYPLVVRKAIFSKTEAEKIALLKTASLLEANRNDVVLTGFKEIYYPMWLAFATVAGQTYEFEISGVTGEIFGEEKVPEREKGFVELTHETLQELKEPDAWIRYSKEIAQIGGGKLRGKGRIAPVEVSGKVTEEAGKIIEKGNFGQPTSFFRKPALWITIILIIVIIALILY